MVSSWTFSIFYLYNQDEDKNLCFYLIARQSKSKRLFLFDPQQLAVSNRNLIEVYTDRNLVQNSTSYEENFDRYVIPSGGLQEGLASQAIVLKMELWIIKYIFVK